MKSVKIPEWDLTDLYKSIYDPKILRDKKRIENDVLSFSKKFKNKSISLESLKSFEAIQNDLDVLSAYAYLIYSKNTKDEKISKFYQDSQEFESSTQNKLTWYEIELIKSNKNVKEYDHFLKLNRAFKPFTLDEKTEVILNKKDQTSSKAFRKLYSQIDSAQSFGKLTYSELSTIFSSDKNRNKRKLAGREIAKDLSKNSKIYLFILNTLLHDKKLNDEIRNFNFPEESTFLSYEVNKKMVESMSETIINNYDLSVRFYKAKSKILNQKLYEWDRYSDIFPKIKKFFSWTNAKDIVLESFKLFSEDFYKIAKSHFDNNWIDARPIFGKNSGAYCIYVSNKIHPYIFLNFTNDAMSVRTLGHELGHAIHGVLSKDNNSLEYRPSTVTAEIASVFSEALIFDNLYEKAQTKEEKINLLGGKLQETFATVFRQNAFYLFEKEAHEKRRQSGELSLKEINDIYQKSLQPMFGKSLTLTDDHKYMWMKISHFYKYNFYVFTYAFGELLAISLYALYKKQGSQFVKNYTNALKMGGSKSPIEITKAMGVDITNQNFWQNGLDLINERVKEFERLVI